MSGTAQSANRDPISALLYQEQASLFFPKPWQAVSSYWWDIVGYAPNATQSWGGMTTWSIPNTVCTYFGKMILKFVLTPATVSLVAPSTGSARYDDFIAYAAWANAYMKYGSNIIDFLDSEFTKFKFYDEMMDTWKRGAIRNYVQGPLSIAERQLLLASGCTCLVELPFWCTRGYANKMPLVLGTDMQFGVQWRNLAEVIDADPADSPAFTVAPTISDVVLLIEQTYGASNEQANLLTHSTTGIAQLMESQIGTRAIATANLGAPGTTQTIGITTPNVNLPVAYQNITLRFLQDISVPYHYKRWIIHGGLGDPDVLFTNAPVWYTTNGNIRQQIGIGVVKPFASSWYRANIGLYDPQIQMDISQQPGTAAASFGALYTANLAGFRVDITLTSVSGAAVTPVIDLWNSCKNAEKYIQGSIFKVFQ